MSGFLLEYLGVLLRWLHVVAAIAWIGDRGGSMPARRRSPCPAGAGAARLRAVVGVPVMVGRGGWRARMGPLYQIQH